jgi:hypothetical protein
MVRLAILRQAPWLTLCACAEQIRDGSCHAPQRGIGDAAFHRLEEEMVRMEMMGGGRDVEKGVSNGARIRHWIIDRGSA